MKDNTDLLKKIYADMPDEVWWVKTIQFIGNPVGIKTFEKMDQIMNKYPQFFEWEHTYASVPQGVHDAYNKEISPFDRANKVSLLEMLESMGEEYENRHNFNVNRDRKKREAWKKHYGPYGLDYRG